MNAISESRFSMKRVYWLLRKHALSEAPIIAIGAGLVLGVNLIALILAGTIPFNHSLSNGAPPAGAWTVAIVLFGLYLASRGLSGMHGSGATEWILLPASGAEKYAASLIWALGVWPIAGALGAMLGSAALSGLAAISGARGGMIWQPWTSDVLLSGAGYLALAPTFIAGSSFWKRNALIKTLGVLVGASVLVVMAGAAFVALSDPVSGRWSGSLSFENGVFRASGNERFESVQPWLQGIVDAWRWILLPGFALAFGYFRVAEKEARDEVQ